MEDEYIEMMEQRFEDTYDDLLSLVAPEYVGKLNKNEVIREAFMCLKDNQDPEDALCEAIEACADEYDEEMTETEWNKKENEATSRWLNNGGWHYGNIPVCM